MEQLGHNLLAFPHRLLGHLFTLESSANERRKEGFLFTLSLSNGIRKSEKRKNTFLQFSSFFIMKRFIL
jgi:hypothetical protein